MEETLLLEQSLFAIATAQTQLSAWTQISAELQEKRFEIIAQSTSHQDTVQSKYNRLFLGDTCHLCPDWRSLPVVKALKLMWRICIRYNAIPNKRPTLHASKSCFVSRTREKRFPIRE
jgi:TorA maturation chaperone TorD